VSVSAQAESIKARFTVYLTIPKELPDDVFNHLVNQETGLDKEEKYKLVHFLNNNLSI
jgi:hypothetical protein